MKRLLILATLFALVSCGKDDGQTIVERTVEVPVDRVVQAPTIPQTEEDFIYELVRDENDYRTSQGQTILDKGLSCVLYSINARYQNLNGSGSSATFINGTTRSYPEYGDRIQSTINFNGVGGQEHITLQGLSQVASYTYTGYFNQLESSINNGMDILPLSLRNTYKDKYMIRCQGQIVITETKSHKFELNSDDGSVLYINGSKLIDNDNNHGPTNVSASKTLRKGVYAFRIDYAQTGGGSQALILKMNDLLLNPKFLYR